MRRLVLISLLFFGIGQALPAQSDTLSDEEKTQRLRALKIELEQWVQDLEEYLEKQEADSLGAELNQELKDLERRWEKLKERSENLSEDEDFEELERAVEKAARAVQKGAESLWRSLGELEESLDKWYNKSKEESNN